MRALLKVQRIVGSDVVDKGLGVHTPNENNGKKNHIQRSLRRCVIGNEWRAERVAAIANTTTTMRARTAWESGEEVQCFGAARDIISHSAHVFGD